MGDGLTTSLEEVVGILSSKYCPECGTRRPVDEAVCPTDGTALRDLSIATDCGWHSSGFSILTGDTSRTSLKEWIEDHVPTTEPHDDFQLRGVVLGGKWQVEKLVGQGSFGAFFLGRHVTLGMQVGIKILRQRFTRSEAGLRLFHNEAMRLSLLHHPGIVQVLDYGEEVDQPYLVMEFLMGTPLHRFLGEKTFTVEDGVEVLRQAAEALIAAHRGVGIGEPLVHLDLKPEHIFLEKIQGRWHVKVIDFGIAEIAAAPTDPVVDEKAGKAKQRLAGTLPYMAPERWEGVVDPRCDLYSLGIVLYEIIAGRKPFDVWDGEAMRILHSQEKPTPPSRHRLTSREPGLRDLDAIVLRLLEKDPARRPQNAEKLVALLEHWQKRPKLTPQQRLARVCLVPAAVLVLALGLVAWGPWERISKIPAILAGPGGASLSVDIFGVGYDRATLRLYSTEREADIELGQVAPGNGSVEISLQLDQLKAAIGPGSNAPGEIDLLAVFIAHGPLGRDLASEPFKVRLDDRPPQILKINGYVPPVDGEALRLLKQGDGKVQLHVQADEPLTVGSCTLNKVRADETKKESLDFVLLDLKEGEVRAELELFDRAGNKATLSRSVDWGSAQAPRLLSLADRLTNKSDYTLVLEWNEPPGTVKLTVDGVMKAFTVVKEADSYWRVTAPVVFEGREGEKRVRIRVEPPGVEPGEEEVLVRFLRRDLTVKEVSSNGTEDSLPVLHVTSGSNEPLNEKLHWDYALVRQGGGSDYSYSAKSLSEPSLQIHATRDLNDKRGKFRVIGDVWDDFGNRSSQFHVAFPFGVEEPTILKFGPNEEGQLIIHHRSCRINQGVPGNITFVYTSDYKYPESLDAELWLGEPSLGSKVVSYTSEDQSNLLTVPLESLRGGLKEGSNKAFLVVTDRETRKRGQKACSLTYEAEPSLKVTPDGDKPLGSEKVPVVVRTQGSGVKTIKVTASGQQVSRVGTGLYYLVRVNAAGKTQVVVEVELKNGCPLEKKVTYCREPIEGGIYAFEQGANRSNVELTYASGLWYTRLQAPAMYEQASRNQEVLKTALQPLLQSLPGGSGAWKVRLPSLKELQGIGPSSPLGGARKQWVREEGPASGDEPFQGFYPCAEWTERGALEARELARESLHYHLVLEVPEQASLLLPGLAVSTHSKQGAKE